MFTENILNALTGAIKIHGNRNAFHIADTDYSYSTFGQKIADIRKALQGISIQNSNIGLVANDDIDTYAAIFAIWLEGLAYVPLHPQQPTDRSLEIIEQADIKLVLSSNGRNNFPGITCLSTRKLPTELMELVPKQVSEDALAYILFTSGSTGKPKGVPISRKNINAFLQSFWETQIQINEHDKCLQCFDLTFDVSIQGFLVPLTRGACTYTIPHDQIKYSYVYGLMENHKITFGAMAPSMIRYLRPYFDEINIPAMRYNILTAEASPGELVNEWSRCLPNAEIYDFYGPTETTIYCTYYRFKKNGIAKQLNGMLSIGKPMPGVIAIIVDEGNNILGKNQKGELCIGGDQVTTGYWKNPEKNRSSFFETIHEGKRTRFYKTGDSCYIDDDGDLMLGGRLDYQVKIQGFRIELGEIEYHTREFLKGKNAVAVAVENSTGNTEIAMFVESENADCNAIFDYLKTKLPYYMLPSQILLEGTFPLNTNGKVDRNVLKKLIPTST